jgi:hypothetical protein
MGHPVMRFSRAGQVHSWHEECAKLTIASGTGTELNDAPHRLGSVHADPGYEAPVTRLRLR